MDAPSTAIASSRVSSRPSDTINDKDGNGRPSEFSLSARFLVIYSSGPPGGIGIVNMSSVLLQATTDTVLYSTQAKKSNNY